MYVKAKKKAVGDLPMLCQHKNCRGWLNQGSKNTFFSVQLGLLK